MRSIQQLIIGGVFLIAAGGLAAAGVEGLRVEAAVTPPLEVKADRAVGLADHGTAGPSFIERSCSIKGTGTDLRSAKPGDIMMRYGDGLLTDIQLVSFNPDLGSDRVTVYAAGEAQVYRWTDLINAGFRLCMPEGLTEPYPDAE